MYPVQKLTQIAVPFHSVMPSVTPVVDTIKRNWQDHNTLIGFMSDHGCHAVEPTEENKMHKGDHGTDSPLDLNVVHYYGVVRAKEK